MIHTSRQMPRGTQVEVYRGDYVIVAQIVWHAGGRAGLKAEERVPVEEIMTLGQAPAFQLTAASGERRKKPRDEDRSRLRGRAVEFAGVVAIAVSLAGAGAVMVREALAAPMASVQAALAVSR